MPFSQRVELRRCRDVAAEGTKGPDRNSSPPERHGFERSRELAKGSASHHRSSSGATEGSNLPRSANESRLSSFWLESIRFSVSTGVVGVEGPPEIGTVR
jgi:hypothetical protein